jgi:hypothetical protein
MKVAFSGGFSNTCRTNLPTAAPKHYTLFPDLRVCRKAGTYLERNAPTYANRRQISALITMPVFPT